MYERIPHGGQEKENITCDFSVNLNPLGMPAGAVRALRDGTACFEEYPDTDCAELRRKLSELWHVPASYIVCGAGAADIIYRLPAALGLKKVLLAVPSFTEYERSLRMNGTEIRVLPADEENGFALSSEFAGAGDGYDAVIISNPVNPSGKLMDPAAYANLLAWCTETNTRLIADECFMSFADEEKQDFYRRANAAAGEAGANVISIRSFTKIFSAAGLRAGYAIFSDAAEAVQTELAGPPWNVSGPAQKAALAALNDDTGFTARTRRFVASEREKLAGGLTQAGFRVFESDVNFILFTAPESFGQQMKDSGILVRDCSDYKGMEAPAGSCFYRIAVRTEMENRYFLSVLKKLTAAGRQKKAGTKASVSHPSADAPHPASIMIQGTMSNAGKSIIAAGLCRIFRQDGYHPAPFKSQNMALNSYITADGSEIGRAQAVQAEAAGTAPVPDMNPVLLKPTTEKGSQVIVNGKVRCSMDASDYFDFRKSLKDDVMAAYDRLGQEHDIIVIEGAGSPVEINLTENGDDFVNMGLAEMTGSPVLLVGDIDRGGVFAQLGGTMMLLDSGDRNRVKGVIANKFRGDISLFSRGREMLADVCGVPVVGVVPWADIDIDDEDSLSARLSNKKANGTASENESNLIKICVIRLPHISNFSDMTALAAAGGVDVRYTDVPADLEDADAVILPGSKNTIGDLQWLRGRGLDAAVAGAAGRGAVITGICGGYQMLGARIDDPGHVESSAGSAPGLGLLPVVTEYESEKETRQTAAVTAGAPGVPAALSGKKLSGYEIHMGRSRILSPDEYLNLTGRTYDPEQVSYFSRTDRGREDGCSAGFVFGTYLHGLFDSADFAEAYCGLLAGKKGIAAPAGISDYRAYREEQYDRLADVLRSSLDMDYIYRIMGLKK